jgi:hypothetical protein
MADILAYKILKQPLFNWGAGNLSVQSEKREQYLTAIKAADREDFRLLMEFARS